MDDKREARQGLILKRRHGPYTTAGCGSPAPLELLLGIEQFNRGEYFEQHETLEELWRSEPDDVRYLYHGILLAGVGLYHLSRGNYRGAVSKLAGGIEKLRWFEPSCHGVDVAALVSDAERCLETATALGPERLTEFDWKLAPRIVIAGGAGVLNSLPGSRDG